MTALWVATSDGLHLIGDEPRVELAGHEVNALERDESSWWALVDGHELWRKGAGGWSKTASIADVRLNCVSVAGADVLVGSSEARLFRLAGENLEPVAGFDDLPDRRDWYTPWGGPPDVRSIARSNGSAFVNVHVGGILRSDDEGSSWRQTIDVGSDVHEVIAPDGDTILAATAYGLGLSRDGGSEWEFADDGLHASYARAVTLADDTIVMSASSGPRGGRAQLYRRSLSGGSFERLEKGLPEWFDHNINTGCVASSGGRVAFATEDGRAFVSEDHGTSWEEIADGLGAARWVAFD
jgi:hypothetical protein